MEWTKQHDILFCQEILAVELRTKKKESNERGKLWMEIVQLLKQCKDLKSNSNPSQGVIGSDFPLFS